MFTCPYRKGRKNEYLYIKFREHGIGRTHRKYTQTQASWRYDGQTRKGVYLLEGMDNEQIKRFALFLFEENQNKSKQLDEMIARLDEIVKNLKKTNRKIDSLTGALLKVNSKTEKAAIEYKLQLKEYKKLEKKHNALVERLSLMNTQIYASSKSLKGIERKKVPERKA